jgi:hypothetical protein
VTNLTGGKLVGRSAERGRVARVVAICEQQAGLSLLEVLQPHQKMISPRRSSSPKAGVSPARDEKPASDDKEHSR